MSETVQKKMSSGYPMKTWGQVVQLGTSLGYPCAVWDNTHIRLNGIKGSRGRATESIKLRLANDPVLEQRVAKLEETVSALLAKNQELSESIIQLKLDDRQEYEELRQEYVELKNLAAIHTTGVYFDVYRHQPYTDEGTIITYNWAEISYGGGIDRNTGIFTAPVKGIYAFHFHCLLYADQTWIQLRKNGVIKGAAGGEAAGSPLRHMSGQTVLVDLSVGDTFDVYLERGSAKAGTGIDIHFVGYLLQPM
ncbi:unnamed protein product [Darwinula stevensoni]|uniref:C1q domain-containing protein n=1 Tax=Darwinula stevensoni TaxID=69355 RepID=A0A7R9AFT7_9CRUS|nr:unnamed protein product [Darwinula stevensoni]CAG0903613.1 unnamed protein product [Darwinula stevensoni]